MTCAHCGEAVPDGSLFCNHCGASTGGGIHLPRLGKNSVNRAGRLTPVLIILIIVLGAIAVYQILESPPKVRAPVAGEMPPTPANQKSGPGGGGSGPATSLLISPLVTPEEFTVGPAGLRYFKVLIDAQTPNASLVGKFKASGGAYNDIEVFVIGGDRSVNPEEGMYAKAVYWSRRVSAREVDVPLSSGEYYLVFSNTWSPSIKTVSAQISIHSQP